MDWMDWKTALNCENPEAIGVVTSYVSLNEVLDEYDMVHMRPGAQAHIHPLIHDIVLTVHNDMKEYWKQFGFLNMSTPAKFAKWLQSAVRVRDDSKEDGEHDASCEDDENL